MARFEGCGVRAVEGRVIRRAGRRSRYRLRKQVVEPVHRQILAGFATADPGSLLEGLDPVLRQAFAQVEADVYVLADGDDRDVASGTPSFKSIPIELRDQAAIVSGFSKTWSMTGWRVGYAAA